MERSATAAPRFLIGTTVHNQHLSNIAHALHDASALESFHTSGIDLTKSPLSRVVRRTAASVYPKLEERLARRTVSGVPAQSMTTSWLWELARLSARELGASDRVVDWIWERS